jgi:L-fucose mutarotase/ribose pyranase (RbsD/FucU family)
MAKAKAKKVTKKELNEVSEVTSRVTNITQEIGSMEITKLEYVDLLKAAKAEQAVIRESLEKKYGSVNINIKTGEISELN